VSAGGYFDVLLWNRYGKHGFDVERILDLGLDVIHVQYENVVYHLDRLHQLMHEFDGPMVVTWHDNCNPPQLRWYDFQHAFTHRAGVGPGNPEVIPFPIRRLAPVVRTFGLGRTREDILSEMCERNGWIFESFATSEQRLGGQSWKPWRDLHDWLRGADAIALFYDDNGMAGSSQAARTAIATRRPVVVNDVTWFAGLPEAVQGFWKAKDAEDMEQILRGVLWTPGVWEKASVHSIVERHVSVYESVL